jgi:hypothetical protein
MGAKRHEFPIIGSSRGPGISEKGLHSSLTLLRDVKMKTKINKLFKSHCWHIYEFWRRTRD